MEKFQSDQNIFNKGTLIVEQVSKPFEITDTVKLATLRTKPSKTGELCTISGWGWTEHANNISNQLLKLDVPIYDHDKCIVRVKENFKYNVTDLIICAGNSEPGTDPCRGDSGGPLTCDDELTGLDSFGALSCGTSTVPNGYTEVYHFINWIKEHAV
ncbi:glandular kallikrein-3, submandibular-like [Arctopsyche grandis]|uniref:glandular kallikrein-3, submandibular-like n=1 Tax=Arctopsyche grandis TaxID=121162 RepID=UPI00406D9283